MFPQEVLDSFEEETGIKVNYNNFDTDEVVPQKLSASNGSDYDLVIVNDYIAEMLIEQELVTKLDTSKISNIGNVNPVYQGKFYDTSNEYTVPYGAGVITLVYEPSKIDIEIDSYSDLWDESLEGKVGLIASNRVVNGITLLSMGESMNTEDVDTIKKAGEKLLELAPNIRLIKDTNLQDDLLSGEIDVALMYASQTTMAKIANPDLKVVFPKEGLGFGIMPQLIPSNAKNSDNAHKFINYILKPEVSKQCFEYLGYYSTNKEADALIEDEYKEFLTLPKNADTDKMEMVENISNEATQAHIEIFTAFKDTTN